jgi:CHAD domain-containing protein
VKNVGEPTTGPAKPAASAAPPPRRRTTCRQAIADAAERELAALSAALSSLVAREDEEGVHDLRVATRRLQAMLTVLDSDAARKPLRKLRRSLRKLRGMLGAWRNADVTLAEVAGRRRRAKSARERAAWRRIEGDLRERRRDDVHLGRRRLRHALERGLADRLAQAIDERLASIPPRDLRRALESRIDETWREWTESCAAAEKEPSIATIHALRIATKRLRYPVELAHEVSRRRSAPVLRWAKRAQKGLGDWHDRQVLHRSIAQAIARPELALEDPDGTLAVLTAIAQERRESPPVGRSIVALAHPEEGLAAMRRWWRGTSRRRNRGGY